jgi:hypothetical protein
MDLATKYVNSLDCTYIGMLSTPLTFDFIEDPRWHREEKDSIIKPALELYKPLIDSFPPSLYEWEMEGQWDTTIQYYVDWKKEIFIDYHPSPVRHYNYLKKINIPITEKSKKFAEDTLIKIHSGNNRNDFVTLFPECQNYRVENMWGK